MIENYPSLKKENRFNVLNLKSEDSEDNENKVEVDIIFEYNRHYLFAIRKEVDKGLSKNISDKDIGMDDGEYYNALGFMK